MAIQKEVVPISLKTANAELQKAVQELKDKNQGWTSDPKLKQAIDRLEAVSKLCANECAQSETYPVF